MPQQGRRIMSPAESKSQPGEALSVFYEMGGLHVRRQVAPWCADAIWVEARVTGQQAGAKQADFTLHGDAVGEVPCTRFVPRDGGIHLARFRIDPPRRDCSFTVRFRGKALYSNPTVVPHLDRESFLGQVNVHFPTVYCQLHGETVSCARFVTSQTRNLVASCALVSEAGLAPLRELEPEVRLMFGEEAMIDRWPIRLSNAQATQTRAIVSMVLDGIPKRAASWDVVWATGESRMAKFEVASYPLTAFIKSLRMGAPRYFHKSATGACSVLDGPVKLKRGELLGPVFAIQSNLQGIAGQLPVVIEAIPKTGEPVPIHVNTMTITDGVNLLAPGMLPCDEINQLIGFRLMYRKQVLQACPADPRPGVRISSEGGFEAPIGLGWTMESENQLRLLLDTLSSQNRAAES